jgi:integrase/recombinase XerD
MKVQRVRLSEHYSWLVLDDEYQPVQPILAYLKFLDNLDRSPNTVRAVAQHLKAYWLFLHEHQVDWTEVDVVHLAEFITWLRHSDPAVVSIESRRAQRTNATIDQMLSSVHGFYDFHLRLHAVPAIPLYRMLAMPNRRYKPFLHGIAKAKPSQTRVVSVAREKRVVKTLTQEQVKQLLNACTNLRDKFLLTLLSECGIRIGQALGLRHEDLSVEDNEIHIVPRRDNVNGARAKTRRSYVIPAVSPSVMQCYTDYLIEELGALEADHLPDYVFVNLWSGEIGRPMTYDAVRSLFRHLSKKTAIAVTPHLLRHTRATTWLRDDHLSLESTSTLLGHTTIQTTRSIYDHRTVDDVREELKAAQQRRSTAHEH